MQLNECRATHVDALPGWQGGRLPIPWPERPKGDGSAQQYMDIDAWRLPPDVPGLYHPDHFQEELTRAWVNWIIAGQLGEVDESRLFQFRWINETSIQTRFQRTESVDSIMHYPPDSRLFIARMLRLEDTDQLACVEVSAQLPKVFDGAPMYAVFNEADLQDVLQHAAGSDILTSLIKFMVKYEHLYPVHVGEHENKLYSS